MDLRHRTLVIRSGEGGGGGLAASPDGIGTLGAMALYEIARLVSQSTVKIRIRSICETQKTPHF